MLVKQMSPSSRPTEPRRTAALASAVVLVVVLGASCSSSPPPAGPDQACGDVSRCEADQVCLKYAGNRACRTRCALGAAACSDGRECVALVGETGGACLTVGQEGDACGGAAHPDCRASLTCVLAGAGAGSGFCRRDCDPVAPSCAADRRCSPALLDRGMCIPGNGGLQVGEQCGPDEPCEVDLICVGPADRTGVCRGVCDILAPGRGCKLPEGNAGRCIDFSPPGKKHGLCVP